MKKYIIPVVMIGMVFFVAFAHLSPKVSKLSYDASLISTAQEFTDEAEEKKITPPPDSRLVVEHTPMPPAVKAIYMSACVVGTPSFRQDLVRLIAETELNSVVIDIKDYSGTISFRPQSESWLPAWEAGTCGAGDMAEFIASLHALNIFVIGRLTVFQDPFYVLRHPELAVKKADGVSLWRDGKGLAFIDVAAKPYWDQVVALSAEAYLVGFDEINYDYVRYPSDGNMSDISFVVSNQSPYGTDKQANLEAFFKYLNEKLDDEKLFSAVKHVNTGRASSTPYTSVDLFGMTTTNFDDLSIGQIQERAVPYFDAVAPMVYPSHYPNSFLGLGNPNNYPYEVVKYAMQAGVNRLKSPTTSIPGFLHTRIGTSTPAIYQKPVYAANKLRTWIQDFDYGGDYDAEDVRAQIQASYDAGVDGWMIWAPSNRYTKAALLGPEKVEI